MFWVASTWKRADARRSFLSPPFLLKEGRNSYVEDALPVSGEKKHFSMGNRSQENSVPTNQSAIIVKGTSLRRKEKATTRIKKIINEKAHQ